MAIPLLIVALLLSSCAVRTTDRVRLNVSGGPHGILVDARDGAGSFDDRGHVFSGNSRSMGRLNAAPNLDEVIAFNPQRPPAIRTPAGFTPNPDQVQVDFAPDKIRIAVKVWIVHTPFLTHRTRAENAAIRAVDIWAAERMGLAFDTFDIADATTDPDAPRYLDFTCAKMAGIKLDIGFSPGMVNVYYVRNVNNSQGRGDACGFGGGSFFALGATADDLLHHEFGHLFNLRHVDVFPNFDFRNVMYPGGMGPRDFLAEGQTFRSHLDPTSSLNAPLYNARPGLPTRPCPTGHASPLDPKCPQLNRRLWADGPSLPAN